MDVGAQGLVGGAGDKAGLQRQSVSHAAKAGVEPERAENGGEVDAGFTSPSRGGSPSAVGREDRLCPDLLGGGVQILEVRDDIGEQGIGLPDRACRRDELFGLRRSGGAAGRAAPLATMQRRSPSRGPFDTFCPRSPTIDGETSWQTGIHVDPCGRAHIVWIDFSSHELMYTMVVP